MVRGAWQVTVHNIARVEHDLATKPPPPPHDPAIPFLGIYPKKNHNSKRYMHPNVNYSTIHNNKDVEAPNRGMDKEDMIHTYNGLLFNHKKEQNNDICSNVDGPRDCHTGEVSQTQKDKYRTILLSCGI